MSLADNRLTTMGMTLGTPASMAPEQVAADPAADQRVDLYALGLVAYEMLAGGGPYSGTTPQQMMAATIPRHRELSDTLARKICRDLDVLIP